MVASFAFYMSTLLFGNPFNGAPREVIVPPSLVGMQQQQAVDALKAAGLTADIRSEFSDKPDGVVYDSSPKSGVEMRSGRPVVLFVSKGSEPITIPDVVGKKRAEAQQALQSAGLVMADTKSEFSEIYEKGEVIAQSPLGGTQAKKKSPVTLIVSKGPEPVPPDEPVAVESPDTTSPPAPDTPDTPTEPAPQADLPVREHEVSIRVPRSARSAQTVKIIVRNEDGSEQTVYEQEHQPGEDVKQTVSTLGNKGKCQIRVYLNDHEISRTDV
jgi:serine/threonine-protein kinase